METFAQYLKKHKVQSDFAQLLHDICSSCVAISTCLSQADKSEFSGGRNIHGEKQLKLDVAANNCFVNVLGRNEQVSLLASEEMEWPIETGSDDGYSVAFDPLDGSSLVDVNLAVGSIVGVYKGKGFLGRKGREQVAALIFVYGPALTCLISLGHGVDEFVYQSENGVFVLSASQLQLKPEAKIFAPGNLRACASEEWYLKLLEYWVKNGYTLRYSGGMVPDVNQILKKGNGVFTYPAYKEKPEGKLRLLYECAPIAYLVEQAGGVATDGKKSILDLTIDSLHQKTPVFLGSKKDVELVESFMKK